LRIFEKKQTVKLHYFLVFIYRIFLVFLFCAISRTIFIAVNNSYLDFSWEQVNVAFLFGGFKFDAAAIGYCFSLFIVASILPFKFVQKSRYQKSLFVLYSISAVFMFVVNAIDWVYFSFTHTRTDHAVFELAKTETNLGATILRSVLGKWYLSLILFALLYCWYFLYKRVSINEDKKFKYVPHIAFFLAILFCTFLGIRGKGFGKGIQPLNVQDAIHHVSNVKHSSIVLNTGFTMFRNLGSKTLMPYHFFDEASCRNIFDTKTKFKTDSAFTKQNLVVIILESFGKEYWGSFNKGYKKTYTPFLDSLAAYSLKCTNAYANGLRSNYGIPAITASLPSMHQPYIGSSFASKNNITSLASILQAEGYQTSFYHGANDGSMGFDGFAKTAGYQQFYGRKAFANDAEFDGSWGIWDEPFLQYQARQLANTKQPFLSTVFTLSSHEPFKVPENYRKRFKEGSLRIHKSIEYTDNAVRQFFNSIKHQPWFNNTLFVFAPDHASISEFEAYESLHGIFKIPILYYKPDNSLRGTNNTLTSQLDIVPTTLQLLQYNKPFFSFGQSILNKKHMRAAVMPLDGGNFQCVTDKYILQTESTNLNPIALFAATDSLQKNNLLNKVTIPDSVHNFIKAYLQTYNNAVINNKLTLGK
jgi:phosphoglycerol transferase MdoB-like AlkP superfamily enzyme